MRHGSQIAKTALCCLFLGAVTALGQQANLSPGEVGFNLSLEGKNFTRAVNVFLLITALSLAPSFIMMLTSFTRIVVVLSFLRQALRTQNVPSGKIITSLALFLTFFIMQPTWQEIYNEAVVPFSQNEISQQTAMHRGTVPIKEFMIQHVRKDTLQLFMKMAHQQPVESVQDMPMRVMVPSFMVSELQTAFQMGFLIYLPFLVIDAVVATFLMSMGMMMLPPMMISLPFKILLFVMVDGWNLVVKALLSSFGGV